MNPRILWAAAVAALITAPIRADDKIPADTATAALIAAPETAAPGELVKLRAQLVYQRDWLRITGSPPENPPTFRWTLADPPEGYEIEDWIFQDGRTCVFATSRPGLYRFVLAGTRLDAEGKPRLFLATHTLTVERPEPPGPEPGPEPTPPEPPEPDLPEGRFGLARLTYQLARQHVPDGSRAVADALAENYRGIAARIAAGTLSEPVEILAETTAGNRRAVGDDAKAWMPFFQQLAARMRELDQGGELKSPEDFQQAWAEIATGLDAVRP